jgi:HTH-type transcriptional repressor of NAD biosynthesis genes
MNAVAAGERYGLGLVVGKFSPFHRGHEWLIVQAAQRCDRLLILSYVNPEFQYCQASARQRWLTARFPEHEIVVFDEQGLAGLCSRAGIAARQLPVNDAGDLAQQQFLAWLLREVLHRSPDAFFCSETYGTECATRLTRELGRTVSAVVFDTSRRLFPISGTAIRQDPTRLQAWLATTAGAAFVRRIALLGGESTGKTSLAAALSAHFDTTWVAEYGRELWEQKSGQLSEGDLIQIAREQIRREDLAVAAASEFLFCDTSPLTTAGYSRWMFGRIAPELASLALRPYDGLILCVPDFPFVQDGTRRDPSFQREQDIWYRERLRHLPCPVLEASGDVPRRVRDASAWLKTLGGRATPWADRAEAKDKAV